MIKRISILLLAVMVFWLFIEMILSHPGEPPTCSTLFTLSGTVLACKDSL